jgi:RHS repeat-associated protein
LISFKEEMSESDAAAQYKYDPFGRRIEKSVNNVITRYLYDGPNVVTEYDEAGNATAKYTHNLAVDDPLAVQQGSSTYYYHKDGLGSVTALTNAAGSVVKRYRYRGFGEIYSEPGSVVQPYTFTARERDPETGLYYYRARYYDPRAGRFISKDPIGFGGGDSNLYRYADSVGKPLIVETNHYRYTSNNPVNRVDPSGLDWKIGPKWYDLHYEYTNNELSQIQREVDKLGQGFADILVRFPGDPILLYFQYNSPYAEFSWFWEKPEDEKKRDPCK